LRQFTQPSLQTVGFDVLKALVVHARRSLVGFAAVIGKSQDVFAVQLVIQGVETVVR